MTCWVLRYHLRHKRLFLSILRDLHSQEGKFFIWSYFTSTIRNQFQSVWLSYEWWRKTKIWSAVGVRKCETSDISSIYWEFILLGCSFHQSSNDWRFATSFWITVLPLIFSTITVLNTVIKFLYKYRHRRPSYQKFYFTVTIRWLKYRMSTIF